MKKYLKYIIGSVIVLSLAVLFGNQTVKGLSLYYVPSSQSISLASTTATFIIGGTGTTTKTFYSDGYQQNSWLIALASSTTQPTLCWINQYSNNGTDWYTQDSFNLASTTPQHVGTENQECFTYATTTATQLISKGTDNLTWYIGRKIVVPNLDTTLTRTIFSITAPGRGMLDIRSSLKNEVTLTK